VKTYQFNVYDRDWKLLETFHNASTLGFEKVGDYVWKQGNTHTGYVKFMGESPQPRIPYMYEVNSSGKMNRDALIKDILDANQDYLQKIIEIRQSSKPQAGDFVLIDERLVRITDISDKEVRFCERGKGGFCLFEDGSTDFSGTFDISVEKINPKQLIYAGFDIDGSGWIHDRGDKTPGNRLDVTIKFKVWSINLFPIDE